MKIQLCLWLMLLNINNAFGINADVQHYNFYIDGVHYTEVVYYLPTTGLKSTYYSDSSFHNSIGLTLLLKKGSQIIKAEKLHLESPRYHQRKPLIHVIRWPLPPGNYLLESTIYDAQNSSQEITLLSSVDVPDYQISVALSDLQLFSICRNTKDTSLMNTKNGFYYEPLPYQFVDRNQNVLYTYLESYHTNKIKRENYFIKYKLFELDSNSNNKLVDEWIFRKDHKERDIILNTRDISQIPSGKYLLKVYLIDRNDFIYDSSAAEFDRYNPFWDKLIYLSYASKKDEQYFSQLSDDSVYISLKSLYPIISSNEQGFIDYLINNNRLAEKRNYLYSYWRENYADSAYYAYSMYMEEVRKVDQMFRSGFGRGFESDRARIYLRYGKPIEVFKEDQDSGAFPYEIWKYDKIKKTGQNNVKFIFYNSDLGGSNYRLLHCNAYGERKNEKWELELYRKVNDEYEGENPFDATGVKRTFSRRAREYFEE
ncbi:MAG: GWxTD domain-containing protein [Saprospiraceae bacterium]|nr:GWxTD domain-containing protein [Saprospiraceae bacterium]